MDLIAACKGFLKFYFYSGLSPYSPSYNRSSKLFGFISHFLQLTVNVLLSAYVLKTTNLPEKRKILRQIGITVINIFALLNANRSIFVFWQCVFQQDAIKEMFERFSQVQIYFAQNLKHRINYQPFVRQHSWKMAIPLFALFIFTIVYIERFNLSSRIWQLTQQLTLLNLIFYIDLIAFHLAELNKVVLRDANSMMDIRILLRTELPEQTRWFFQQLKSYKLIHFSLWELSMLHSSVFGPCMLALLLNILFDLVYSTFWLFFELNLRSGVYSTCRECHHIYIIYPYFSISM